LVARYSKEENQEEKSKIVNEVRHSNLIVPTCGDDNLPKKEFPTVRSKDLA
jgi:hypothetical protein